jgi:hypothetical protein
MITDIHVLSRITFSFAILVCQLHKNPVKKDQPRQQGDRVCPFSSNGNSFAVQGNITAWNTRVWRSKSKCSTYSILIIIPNWLDCLLSFQFLQTRRRIAKYPERVPLPPPFASYNAISRAAPSRANSFRSVSSHPREEATVDSTILQSVTSPPAAETRASELQVRQKLSCCLVGCLHIDSDKIRRVICLVKPKKM